MKTEYPKYSKFLWRTLRGRRAPRAPRQRRRPPGGRRRKIMLLKVQRYLYERGNEGRWGGDALNAKITIDSGHVPRSDSIVVFNPNSPEDLSRTGRPLAVEVYRPVNFTRNLIKLITPGGTRWKNIRRPQAPPLRTKALAVATQGDTSPGLKLSQAAKLNTNAGAADAAAALSPPRARPQRLKYKEFSSTEELLALQQQKGTTTEQDIYNEVQKVFTDFGLPWSKSVGVCTDGVSSMVGLRKGYLNDLNLKLQKRGQLYSHLKAFQDKIRLWEAQMLSGNTALSVYENVTYAQYAEELRQNSPRRGRSPKTRSVCNETNDYEAFLGTVSGRRAYRP
ncbi:hypothetical protein EVAR_44812_1 [Eumeta japonica]|uniref:Uncharacterized protein n=1 Tax=Eumeta variegata TaxID=151549 RepID=A0A4C1X723_EUMVA|nr:hypothetical protein EVAR_44812_1 [Eumeta japonica]